MAKQTIFLDGFPPYDLERPRGWPSPFVPDAWGYAQSLALICPKCLKQWAILAFPEDGEIHPQGAYCEQHGGGTLFWDWHFDPVLLNQLPEPLLRREFQLTLREMENRV